MTQRFLWYKIDIMIGKFEFVLKWVFSEKYASETWKKMNVIKLFMEKIYPYFLLIWNSNNGPFYGGAVIAQWFRLHLPFPPRFESQAFLQCFYHLWSNLWCICHCVVKRTKKRPDMVHLNKRNGPFLNQLTLLV